MIAGANFLVKKPVTADGGTLHIALAQDLMMSEQRHYFRRPVNLHVLPNDEDCQRHAKITDLSDGGMAVRTARSLKASLVEFAFDLSFGTNLTGKGQATWTNSEDVPN